MNINFKSWLIRYAMENDLEGICEVFKKSVKEICAYHPGYNKETVEFWNSNKTIENMKKLLEKPGNIFLVAENKKNLEGVGLINIKTCELHACYLIKRALGHGLGKKLMNVMIEKAKDNKLDKITLGASLNAKDFYEKMGFTLISEHLELQPPNGVPHYRMEMKLT